MCTPSIVEAVKNLELLNHTRVLIYDNKCNRIIFIQLIRSKIRNIVLFVSLNLIELLNSSTSSRNKNTSLGPGQIPLCWRTVQYVGKKDKTALSH